MVAVEKAGLITGNRCHRLPEWLPPDAGTANTYTPTMSRPVRYTSAEAEHAVSRNPRADAISAELRRRTIERIQSGEANEVIDDPLSALIEGARASS